MPPIRTAEIEFKRVWGAYFAGYGFNAVDPGARRRRHPAVPDQERRARARAIPAIAAAFSVEFIFDLTIAVPVLAYAFSQGVFPKPPDFSSLPAFDLAFFASNPRFTLFLLTALGIGAMVAFALLSARVRAFWARVRQGLTILRDRRRYFREVWLVQFAGWLCRFAAFWCLLEAFNVGGSVCNVLLVLGVNAVAALVPFTPGGAGVQQALLVKVFGSGRDGRGVLGRPADRDRGADVRPRARRRWCGSSSSARSRRSSAAGRAQREAEKAAKRDVNLAADASRSTAPRCSRSSPRGRCRAWRRWSATPTAAACPTAASLDVTVHADGIETDNPAVADVLRPRRARRARSRTCSGATRACASRPGARVPGVVDGYEIAIRAVLGQQISVQAAAHARRPARGRRRASRWQSPAAPSRTCSRPLEAIAAAPDSAFAMPVRRRDDAALARRARRSTT